MALAGSPARVTASSPLLDRGQAARLVGDGDHWLVVVQAGSVSATDTLGGRRRTLLIDDICRVQGPAPWTPAQDPQRPDSRDDPRGGPNTTYGKPFVIDLATGTSAAVPNAVLSSRDAFGTADPGWRSLDGFEGPLGGYHCENSEEYVNRHASERRTVDAFDDEPPVADLDDPQLRPVARAGGPIRGYLLRKRQRRTWTVPGNVPGVVLSLVSTRNRVTVTRAPCRPARQGPC